MTLSCQEVSFGYGRGRPLVLDGLTWQPNSGVALLLGPNGAGKSTLLNLIASISAPSAGDLTLGDLRLSRARSRLKEWRRRVGWVPQQVNCIPGMTVREQIAYAGWLKGMSRADAARASSIAIERVGLMAKADERATRLSGGQTRRMGIASALVHDSDLVVMDEPTAGLDPAQRARLYRVIQSMPEVNWVISTHQVEDLALQGSQVSVLAAGDMVWQGSADDFVALGGSSGGAVAAYRSLVGEEE